MLHSGLVSITFRSLTPRQIIDLCIEAKIESIEWGGDIHVPHGDIETATRVGELSRAAGIATPTYGSYYRAGQSEEEGLPFRQVLASAVALDAPAIRIWAGSMDSADADEIEWTRVVGDLQRIGALAASQNRQIVMEYHQGTLNDTAPSSLSLMKRTGAENLKTLWQTTNGKPDAYCQDTLVRLRDHVPHVHIFNWLMEDNERTPLAAGAERWASFLNLLAEQTDRDRYVLMEYVMNDTPEQFLKDAAVLDRWLDSANGNRPAGRASHR